MLEDIAAAALLLIASVLAQWIVLALLYFGLGLREWLSTATRDSESMDRFVIAFPVAVAVEFAAWLGSPGRIWKILVDKDQGTQQPRGPATGS